MYISSVKITNIRCFQNLHLTLGAPGSSLLVFGDNGDGKSTLLRSIAMGLCDENSAAALFRELAGEFVRRDPTNGQVPIDVGTIEIELSHEGRQFVIVTAIESLQEFEQVTRRGKHGGFFEVLGKKRHRIEQSDFPWNKLFLVGYGAGTRTQGTLDFQHYVPVDAVYPLFSYTVPLQNPELVIRRIVDTARQSSPNPKTQSERANAILDKLKKTLQEILRLDKPNDLDLTPTGIKVHGHWGNAELGELGDGYRATITWILDLLAWWFLRSVSHTGERANDTWTTFQAAALEGIVIIDEVEQHLHPRWQRSILRLLRTTFPHIQFIAASHSPLCALGTTDLEDNAVDLVVLEPADGHVRATVFDPPRGKRADQILTSELFGLRTASDNATQAEIEEFAELAAMERDAGQEARYRTLQTRLDAKLGSPQTKLEQFVADEIQKILLATPLSEQSNAAVQYEVLRQLRSLLA